MVSPTKAESRSVKILLVEDNLGDANLTLETLKDSTVPVEVVRVQDGDSALRYLKKQTPYETSTNPHLILLDLNMPQKTGLEVLQEIKADASLSEIPVLILTCSKSDADIRKAYDSKANFYIVKPSDLDEFYGVMKYVEEVWLKGFQAKLE